jgi:hypothetical protein
LEVYFLIQIQGIEMLWLLYVNFLLNVFNI